ncbi:PAS domain-containing sensor histidine kinase [Nitrospirillum sp. BR 11828]|uniref:sensor histidine kinase n=1 Tax=Nitrospirillum sp. BR 11828 TaxID=3104325 RepID=UPI002ACAB09B|nr:PAS domain-containing sensor histidine kinase [Nitrospirillum sp. BR 11828]MDZ5646630.1 PAS domain-containing sensor histidine kinase [Nitrospirillum sp. BR 11828]
MRLGAATRICLGYAVFGGAWVLGSDIFLKTVLDGVHAAWLAPVKGVGFVLVTALLLHRVLVRALAVDARKTRDLALSEARYSALAEMAPVGIFHVDADGQITYRNPRLREISGLPAELDPGGSWEWWLIHPEDHKRAQSRWLAATQAGERFAEEFRIRRHDGRIVWVLCEAVPVTAREGERMGYVGMALDLTAQHLAAEGVRQEKERYELATAGSAVGIWDWQLGDGSLHLSGQALTLLRLPSGEVAPRRVLGMIPKAERARAFAHVRGTLRLRRPFDLELPLVCADGVTRWFHVRGQGVWPATTLAENPSRPTRLLGSLMDITARKETEGQLARARHDAEMASRSKTAFLASMSHELRTPLNAIIGFSELITQQTYGPVGDPRYADYAEDIRVSGLHLLELVNDILDVARMEAGRFELEDKVVDIAAEVAVAVRQIQAGNLQRQLEISVAPGTEGLHAMLDPTALRQVLLNLVGNAVKFTPDGGRVTVAGEIRRDGLALSVTDTGPGISRFVLDNLGTQPFLQAEPSLRRRHGGSGLGLFIVRRLMDLHGGTLHVECPADGGTRVTVVFPPDRQVPPGPSLAISP